MGRRPFDRRNPRLLSTRRGATIAMHSLPGMQQIRNIAGMPLVGTLLQHCDGLLSLCIAFVAGRAACSRVSAHALTPIVRSGDPDAISHQPIATQGVSCGRRVYRSATLQ